MLLMLRYGAAALYVFLVAVGDQIYAIYHNCELMTIIIIDILMILYVKVFIKLGNTPFEHFSRHCYIISKSSNLTILYVHGKRFEIEVWLHIL
jgi:hypothetical protein